MNDTIRYLARSPRVHASGALLNAILTAIYVPMGWWWAAVFAAMTALLLAQRAYRFRDTTYADGTLSNGQ